MYTLSRQVRFSIDPFSDEQQMGDNSYASKPCGQGFGFYVSLWIDLSGGLDSDTGFVVNVSRIDQAVRQEVVPLFAAAFKAGHQNSQIHTADSLIRLLTQSWKAVCNSFRPRSITQLRLEINPYTQISIDSEEAKMFTYSEKFEFAAMHKLWNDQFDQAKNDELFGKCANLAGHGHNYILEVQIQCQRDLLEDNWKSDYQKEVKNNFLDLVDHKNLNLDVQEFKSMNPTVENLSYLAWQKLENKFKNAKLHNITVWENDRTFCSYKE
jgi:6-pyruvoyltetrahydropterin/6-carboxytetrahydropterin synthase